MYSIQHLKKYKYHENYYRDAKRSEALKFGLISCILKRFIVGHSVFFIVQEFAKKIIGFFPQVFSYSINDLWDSCISLKRVQSFCRDDASLESLKKLFFRAQNHLISCHVFGQFIPRACVGKINITYHKICRFRSDIVGVDIHGSGFVGRRGSLKRASLQQVPLVSEAGARQHLKENGTDSFILFIGNCL